MKVWKLFVKMDKRWFFFNEINKSISNNTSQAAVWWRLLYGKCHVEIRGSDSMESMMSRANYIIPMVLHAEFCQSVSNGNSCIHVFNNEYCDNHIIISLSSLCRLIWKHWTTKMLVRYMMPSVCLRLRQFSQLSLYSLYGAVCLQLTQFSCDDRENVYFILLSSSNRKYE